MTNSEFRETYGANPDCPIGCKKFCRLYSDLESASRLPGDKQTPKVNAFKPTPRHKGYVDCANGFEDVIEKAIREMSFTNESREILRSIKLDE